MGGGGGGVSDEEGGHSDEARDHLDSLTRAAGFVGEDNPYGDSNIREKFVWAKKREQEQKKGITEEQARRRDLSRREEIKEELEKLRVRRDQRELERQMYEQELVTKLADSALLNTSLILICIPIAPSATHSRDRDVWGS